MIDLSSIELLQHGVGKTKFSGKHLMDIYYRTLTNATSWDQALGYFRLSAMRLLAYPLAKFILFNKGKIRIYCNEQFAENDFTILSQSKKYTLTNSDIFNDLISLKEALQDTHSKLFTDCISFLIQNERLSIKVLVKKNGSIGIAHEKNGIFHDNNGNIVMLSGSANASEQAFLFNRENTNAFCSFWNEWSSSETINSSVKSFENIFAKGDDEWSILDIDSKELKDKIKEIGFQDVDETQLYDSSVTFIKLNKQIFSEEIQHEIENEIIEMSTNNDSIINKIISHHASNFEFVFPLEKLRPYQNAAINAWINNGFNGIFAMATGTGKTYTAFGAISYFLKDNPNTIICIFCPYHHLIEQWGDQIQGFGVKPILIYSEVKWREELNRGLRLNRATGKPIFIVASNNSLLLSSDFSKMMSKYWDNTFLISDEAHNVGSGNLKNCLPLSTKARLGLSATIDRYFDMDGTEFLKKYFGGVVYELSLKDSIGKFLVHYDYFPIPVPLHENEFEEYLSLTKKIKKTSHSTDSRTEEINFNLLMQRARLTNNSCAKNEWLKNNISKNQDFLYTLFYVGDERFQEIIDLLSFEKNIVAEGFYSETKNRKQILTEFDRKIIKCLVAMKCLDEGVDVPATRIAYFLANSGNPKEFVQRRGRVLRKSPETGKTKAILYDLVSVPPNRITKNDESFSECKSALITQFKRIKEFASLADNRFSSLDSMTEIIDKYDLYTEI